MSPQCYFPSPNQSIHFLPPQSPADFSDLVTESLSSTPSAASTVSSSSDHDDTPPSTPPYLSSSAPDSDTAASSPPRSTRRSGSLIPRPRNAFMIFRSEFSQEKIKRTVERDHRHISRIIGHYWNHLSDSEKAVWRLKAEQEKAEHMKKYPGYKFTPTARAQRPLKRNVRRNGKDDLMRCKRVAALLLEGKEGDELETAVKDIDSNMPHQPQERKKAKRKDLTVISMEQTSPHFSGASEHFDLPAFRSPLLPPSEPVAVSSIPMHSSIAMASQVQDGFNCVVPQASAFNCDLGIGQLDNVNGYCYPLDTAQWMQSQPMATSDTYSTLANYSATDYSSPAGDFYYQNMPAEAYSSYQHCVSNIPADLNMEFWGPGNDYYQGTTYWPVTQ